MIISPPPPNRHVMLVVSALLKSTTQRVNKAFWCFIGCRLEIFNHSVWTIIISNPQWVGTLVGMILEFKVPRCGCDQESVRWYGVPFPVMPLWFHGLIQLEAV